uniref:Extensin n=1 Tax=Streptomyces sp. NBC_00003 TaxID=2903608 RepID=A0AAU2V413_9ACTN
MADERHEWLDGDAAERLLRGEGVEPGDERARAEADRLSALLRSLARNEPATTELPGEAAALAAFRKARPEGAPAAEALGVVRVGRAAEARQAPRRRRFAPVRLGLAAAVACCALGGVAVAAGTGVLPGPFAFDGQDPSPASTVSAEATPGPVATSPSHSLPPGSPTPDRHGPSTGTGTPGGSSHSASPDGSATGSTGDADKKGGTQPGGSGGDNDGSGQWLADRADDCRDYRSGKLDEDKRRSLESAAHGPAAVKAFCDLLLDGKGGKSGGAGGGSDGGSGDGGKGKDKGKGGASGNWNGGGGGGKRSSVTTGPSHLLDWLNPAALTPPAQH